MCFGIAQLTKHCKNSFPRNFSRQNLLSFTALLSYLSKLIAVSPDCVTALESHACLYTDGLCESIRAGVNCGGEHQNKQSLWEGRVTFAFISQDIKTLPERRCHCALHPACTHRRSHIQILLSEELGQICTARHTNIKEAEASSKLWDHPTITFQRWTSLQLCLSLWLQREVIRLCWSSQWDSVCSQTDFTCLRPEILFPARIHQDIKPDAIFHVMVEMGQPDLAISFQQRFVWVSNWLRLKA